MNFSEFQQILNKNKKCDKCEVDYKSGNWLVEFKHEVACFECKKCGFKKEVL
ncbi:MAG: hypothetical protein ACRCWG_06550 [Sarcina sp.]